MSELVRPYGIEIPVAVDRFGLAEPALPSAPRASGVVPVETSDGHRGSAPWLSHTSIAIVDEHAFTRECLAILFRRLGEQIKISDFSACREVLSSGKEYDLVLYREYGRSQKQREQRDAELYNLMEKYAVVIMGSHDEPGTIRRAFAQGARGFIPTESASIDTALQIIRLVKAGGIFVPLSGRPQRSNSRAVEAPSIPVSRFTAREQAILDLLQRGESNKRIAYYLKMSESTVKIHVRNIMKKTEARNRTEAISRILSPTGSNPV